MKYFPCPETRNTNFINKGHHDHHNGNDELKISIGLWKTDLMSREDETRDSVIKKKV